jgi:hypothetical protein
MMLKTKKIVDQSNQIVFKTDLIAEDDVDRKILTELESGKIPTINKMIEDLIINEAIALRQKYQPSWAYTYQKSEGDTSYFIHLKRSNRKE